MAIYRWPSADYLTWPGRQAGYSASQMIGPIIIAESYEPMLFRTIEVPDTQGELHNAALLCGFLATQKEQMFLLYSLNEKVDDDLVRVYLTAIEKNADSVNMCSATADDFKCAAQTLKSVLRDANSPDGQQTDDSYCIIDLENANFTCTPAHTHHSLKISEAWLLKLLEFNPGGFANEGARTAAIDTAPIAAQTASAPVKAELNLSLQGTEYGLAIPTARPYQRSHLEAMQSLLNQITPASGSSRASADSPVPSPPPAPIAETGSAARRTELQAMSEAQSVPIRTDQSLKTLLTNVQAHTATLLGKYARLEQQQRQQDQKERELTLREASVLQREQELMEGITALLTAEEKLNNLINA